MTEEFARVIEELCQVWYPCIDFGDSVRSPSSLFYATPCNYLGDDNLCSKFT